MAKKPSNKEAEIEIEPDAWPRFERLVSAAAKIGPQPKKQPPKPKKKKRVTPAAKPEH